MFLKNKNIIFKIRRSKVTDYAALRGYLAQYKAKNKSCFSLISSYFFIRITVKCKNLVSESDHFGTNLKLLTETLT